MITLDEYADSRANLHDELIAGFKLRIAAMTEKLLEQFVATGHGNHIHRIGRVYGAETGDGMTDRFICWEDTARLTLRHSMTMDGGILTWTVTPEMTMPVPPEIDPTLKIEI